ncbi:MAG: hypothetical protein PHX80_03735 [Candidatus Nanoarchaeia archaeon]|nr:hypothetical protein [Candidatus Nanoarchaeia archaeon]
MDIIHCAKEYEAVYYDGNVDLVVKLFKFMESITKSKLPNWLYGPYDRIVTLHNGEKMHPNSYLVFDENNPIEMHCISSEDFVREYRKVKE